jgi:hypothetical protein
VGVAELGPDLVLAGGVGTKAWSLREPSRIEASVK